MDTFDCPWCIAKAGELCYAQPRSGYDPIRTLNHTHLGRLALGHDAGWTL